jgi:hypothetical protein
MADPSGSEVEALRVENDQLRARLAAERSARNARWRGIATGTLTVLAVLATTVALLTVWTWRTLTDTDLFVDRVGGIIEQSEVAEAVGALAAEQLVDALELEDRLAAQLPDEVSILAAPISGAAQNYLGQGVTALAETSAVQQAWDVALAAGHEATIAVLSGSDRTLVENTDGVITLNLTPIVNEVVAQGEEFLSDLLGRDIQAPDLSEEDIDAAVADLEDQLGVQLPADFGQVVLFESDDLAAAQQAYATSRLVAWVGLVAAVLLVAIALVVSPTRLRTGLWIVAGVASLSLLILLGLQPLRSSIVGAAATQGLDGAVSAGFESLFSTLRVVIVVVLALGAVAILALVLTRRSQPSSPQDVLQRSSRFSARHRGMLLGGGAAVAVGLALLVPGQSTSQLLTVALLYGIYAGGVLLAAGLGLHDDDVDEDHGVEEPATVS